MNRRSQTIPLFLVMVFTVSLASASDSEDRSTDRMTQGALVGASTNVVAGAALDHITDSPSSTQVQYTRVQGPDGQYYLQPVATAPSANEANKTVLKRAIQGAVTGAVAAEMSSDGPKKGGSGSMASNTIDTKSITQSVSSISNTSKEDTGHVQRKKSKKSKVGHRPPGWDRGRKEGWGGDDEPPGLARK